MAKGLVCPVNYASLENAGSASSITTTESPSVTAGNLIVVATRVNSVSVTVTSVTDTAGNTYTKINSTFTSSVTSFEMWYAWNITGHAANFITANFSAAVGSRGILAVEFQGVLSSSDPLDTSAGAASVSSISTLVTGAYTTTEAEELLIMMAQEESASSIWQAYSVNHFGVVATTNPLPVECCAYRINLAIETGATALIGSNGNVPRQVIVAAFKLKDIASGGGTHAAAF